MKKKQTDGQTNGCIDRGERLRDTDRVQKKQTDGQTNGCIDRRMVRQRREIKRYRQGEKVADRWTDKWMYRQMDGQTEERD